MDFNIYKKFFSEVFTKEELVPYEDSNKSDIDLSIINLIDTLIDEGLNPKYLYTVRKNFTTVIYYDKYNLLTFPMLGLPNMMNLSVFNDLFDEQTSNIDSNNYFDYLSKIELAFPSLLNIALQEVFYQIPSDQVYQVMEDLYTSADFIAPFITHDMWQKIFENQPKEKRTEAFDKLKEYLGCTTLPETMTIYRGVGSESTPLDSTYSWTISAKEVLKFFLYSPGASWYEATVSTEDIFNFYVDREEAEVWVHPTSVRNIEEHQQQDLAYVQNVLGNNDYSELFSFIRSNIIDTDASFPMALNIERPISQNNYHSGKHLANVMFAGLMIGHEMDLNRQDMLIIMLSAAIHDFARKNDLDDSSHGYRSAKEWVEALSDEADYDNMSEEQWDVVAENLTDFLGLGYSNDMISSYIEVFPIDAMILFTLVRVHDLEDFEGESYIEQNIPTPEINRAKLLLSILKDADALDRIRISDLDLSYLRTSASKKVVKTFFDYEKMIESY